MKLTIYQVDAFAKDVFTGNPAAVVPLQEWLTDDLLQSIAMENNLAETVFYVPSGDHFGIRWFTPTVEVDLCGHATLAAAHVLFEQENHPAKELVFQSPRSGRLTVRRNDDLLSLNFPADSFHPVEITALLRSCTNAVPLEAYKGKTDYMLVYGSRAEVLDAVPNLEKIAQLEARGLIITAPGKNCDFVSRFFAPQSGINEDPVTGSAHTTLVPYWRQVLGKDELSAMQLSARRGWLSCRWLGGTGTPTNADRVEISGRAVLFMKGEIFLHDSPS